MSIERATRLWRTVRIAYSLHQPAPLRRASRSAAPAADLLLVPLTLLMLALFLFGSVPGASDMIAAACATACMP